jgi:hypothetical protein
VLLFAETETRILLVQEQLDGLAVVREQMLEKMQSKQVKDSLLELRKYRRPPRAAAQVLSSYPAA